MRYAYQRGLNYFFWCSDLHHHIYQRQVEAIRELCGRGSQQRKNIVLACATYIDHPEKLAGVVRDQLYELNLDYVDVFFWGWMTQPPGPLYRDGIKALRDPIEFGRYRDSVEARATAILGDLANACRALSSIAVRAHA